MNLYTIFRVLGVLDTYPTAFVIDKMPFGLPVRMRLPISHPILQIHLQSLDEPSKPLTQIAYLRHIDCRK